MKKVLIPVLLFFLFFLTSCVEQDIRHDIYVTVYPLEYITEELLKNTVYTVGIVPGVTSHQDSVDWSPKEIIAMTEADYLFYVGANYDLYIDLQIESNFTNKPVELIRFENQTEYITFIPGIIDDHDHETTEVTTDETLGIDPHFWISPAKILDSTNLIFDLLLTKYPYLETTLQTNYDALVEKLTLLDEAFTLVISNQQKDAMFSTNLYGYLREDYGLEYLSISPGYHEETEQFTTQQKDEIVNDAILHEIEYIIYEKYTSSPLSTAIFTELELGGYHPIKVEYDILQSITDEDKLLGKDYISVMYENLELLKLAIGYIEE